MSFNASVSCVTRHSAEESLEQYAEQSRKVERFCDVCVKSGNVSFSAHRLVLACYSQFFEKLFQSPMREQYQGTVELNELDGESVKNLVDFMYTRNITIDYENVFDLLSTAHFLQMNEVCDFCFEYLKTTINIENWSTILSVLDLYENDLLSNEVHQFICKNLHDIAQSESFKALTHQNLTSILQEQQDRKFVEDVSIFNAVVSWVRNDEANRKNKLSDLLSMLNLHNFPCDFLEDVVSCDPLVKKNADCLNIVMTAIKRQFKEMRLKERYSKLISVGGTHTLSKVVEVYNEHDKSSIVYPDLPQQLFYIKSLEMSKCIYSIGGSISTDMLTMTDKVYRMNKNNPTWNEVAHMNEERSCMAAAVFKDCLVVTGGISNGKNRIRSSELYISALNIWTPFSKLNCSRSAAELVVCDGCLYALGGYDGEKDLSSVERLSDLAQEWEVAEPMTYSRSLFAAVNCNEEIYAIGGLCMNDTDNETKTKTVEKFSPIENKWTFVSDMKIERYAHAACLLNNKIFVVGGLDMNERPIKIIECYDPSTDTWTIMNEVSDDFVQHSLVAL